MKLLLVLAVFAVASCGGPASTSSPQPSAGLPNGRYFVQFTGYVGVPVGESAYLQVAFIDASAGGPLATPDPTGLELQTDHGTFPGIVDAVTPRPEDSGYRLTSVLFHVDGLQAGVFRASTVSFDDGSTHGRNVAIGAWTIEVLDKTPFHGVSERESSIQADQFAQLETTVRNDTNGPVTVTGLRFVLPDAPVKVSMFLPAEQASPDASGFQQTDDKSVTEVTLSPSAVQAIRFRFDPPAVAQFIVLQPVLQFHDAQGNEGLMQMSMNVYSAPFASTAEMTKYCLSVPAAAIVR